MSNLKDIFGDEIYLDSLSKDIIQKKYTSKAQTINLAADNMPSVPLSEVRIISGDVHNVINATFIGAKDSINTPELIAFYDHHIMGDAAHVSGSSFSGGADTFNLKLGFPEGQGSGLDVVFSGDALSGNVSTLRGGHDNITLSTSTSLSLVHVIGDIRTVANSTVIAGNDKIIIDGKISASIYADAQYILGHNTFSGGHDTVIAREASLKTVSLGHGNNILEAASAEAITSGNGNDKVTLDHIPWMLDQGISLGGGNDTLSVEDTAFAFSLSIQPAIEMGSGADSIKLGDIQWRTIYADNRFYNPVAYNDYTKGFGNDTIIIRNILDGVDDDTFGNLFEASLSSTDYHTNIYGHGGHDKIIIEELVEGADIFGDRGDNDGYRTVHGNDTIIINNSNVHKDLDSEKSTEVFGDGGNDSIVSNGESIKSYYYAGDGNDTFVSTHENSKFNAGSTFYGGQGRDVVKISTMQDSRVYGDSGGNASPDVADHISVTIARDSVISGDEGNDTIIVEDATFSVGSSGLISGGVGNDSITINDIRGSSDDEENVDGGFGNDTITITTAQDAVIFGGYGEDKLIIETVRKTIVTNESISIINAGEGDDSISITESLQGSSVYGYDGADSINIALTSGSTIRGDSGIAVDDAARGGDDTITITETQGTNDIYGDTGDDVIKITSFMSKETTISGGEGNDSIHIQKLSTAAIINGDAGNDTVTIEDFGTDFANINLGAGDDLLYLNKGFYLHTVGEDLGSNINLGDGADTLQVNGVYSYSFSGNNDTLMAKDLSFRARYNASDSNDGLVITGTLSNTVFMDGKNMGGGDDLLQIFARKSHITDADIVKMLGNVGHDTLNVNWAFNGIFTTGNDGGTLIAKGLGSKAELNFGNGNDALLVTGALSGKHTITMGLGSDTLLLSLGSDDKLVYVQDGFKDDITLKGTYNRGMVTNADGNAITLTTSTQGGSITLDTWGSGGVGFHNGADTFTVNKALVGKSTAIKDIQTFSGNDDIELYSTNYVSIDTATGDDQISITKTATQTSIAAGTGVDSIHVGALGSGSMLSYDTAGADSISLQGTYNYGMATSITGSSVLNGLATGDDGGSIHLATLGTGRLLFGNGNDTLTLSKALTSTNSIKDFSTGGGDDTITLYSVNGVVVDGGNDDDSIEATSVGSTGVLFGAAGEDTLTLGQTYTTVATFNKAPALANSGIIDGGDNDDTITIGHFLLDDGGTIINRKGSINGGKVLGGDGDDTITIAGLGGSAMVNGGGDSNTIEVSTMTGGSIVSQAGNDNITITTMRGGSIATNGSDSINIQALSGGSLSIAGGDTVNITTVSGGTINTSKQNDAGSASIAIDTMSNGRINGSTLIDSIRIEEKMTKGTIDGGQNNDSIILEVFAGGTVYGGEGNDDISTNTMTGGTIYAEEDNDTLSVTDMNGGIIYGEEGNDSFTVTNLFAGTINGGDGDDSFRVTNIVNGKILGGAGDDTLTLFGDNLQLGSALYIDLGTGENKIVLETDFDGKKLLLGKTADTLELTGDVTRNNTLNLGAGNDTIQIASDVADTHATYHVFIDSGAGDDSISLSTAAAGTVIHSGDGNDSINITTIDGTKADQILGMTNEERVVVVDGGTGNDSISAENVEFAHLYTGTGNNSITVQGITFDSTIYSSTGHDSINLENFDNCTLHNAGGNDSVTITEAAYANLYLTAGNNSINVGIAANTDIISGSGNDTVNIGVKFTYGSISLGTGSDSIYIPKSQGVYPSFEGSTLHFDTKGHDVIRLETYKHGFVVDGEGMPINLSTGSDGGTIEIYDWQNGDIDFGDGNDAFTVHEALQVQKLNFGLGSDTISLNFAMSNEGENTDFVENFLNYDVRGYDSITLYNYDESMLGEIKGISTKALSTGTDGGSISISSWQSGAISFGNGNDKFTYANGDGSATLLSDLTFGLGTDNIDISAGFAGHSISYDNRGRDSISLATYDNDNNMIKDSKGNNADLNTGNDGGSLSIDSWLSGDIVFGQGHDKLELKSTLITDLDFAAGNDTFILSQALNAKSVTLGSGNDVAHMNNITEAGAILDLGTGNDSVKIATLSSDALRYDNKGQDTIEVSELISGTLTTGDDGGTIIVDDWTGGDIIFGKGNDVFETGILEKEVDLGLGKDSVSIRFLDAAEGGKLLYDAKGFDSIHINEFNGNNGAKISTGDDGGFISIGSISAAAGVADLEFGKGNDVFTIDRLQIILGDTTSLIDLGGGNDRITIGVLASNGIHAGEGNNTITATHLGGGQVLSGGGADTITITTAMNGYLDAGHGNNIIRTNNVGNGSGNDTATILAGKGNDVITITGSESNQGLYGTVNVGDGNNKVTLHTFGDSGKLIAGSGNDVITIYKDMEGSLQAGAGSNKITVEGSALEGSKIEGGGGVDNIVVKNTFNGSIIAGDGANKITLATADSQTSITSGKHGDTLTMDAALGSTIDTGAGGDTINMDMASAGAELQAGAGHDKITITRVEDKAQLYGGDNNDTFNIQNLDDATLNGDANDDIFIITNVQSGTVHGGEGDDSFKLSTVVTGTLNGNDGDDTFIITTMQGGTLDGGAQADRFSIKSLTGGTVLGGSENDSFNITNASNALIYGDAQTSGVGNDVMTITTALQSNIYAGGGNDKLTVKVFEGTSTVDAILQGDAGKDNIHITTAKHAAIYGDVAGLTASDEKLHIDNIFVASAKDSDIFAGIGADKVTVTTAHTANIYGDAGNDSLKVTTLFTSTLDGGSGDDTISIGSAQAGSRILGDIGDDVISVATLRDSSILGGNDNDTLKVTTSLYSSTLDGGSGDDTIQVKINGESHGALTGGIGADKFTITGTKNSEIRITDFSANDSLFINSRNVSDAAHDAIANGDTSYAYAGITIYFS